MKSITIQIQPEQNSRVDVSRLVSSIKKLPKIENIQVVNGDDNGPYTTVVFQTRHLGRTWLDIKTELIKNNPVDSACMIIACEGDHGWDDYLLLHHFDSSEKLDKIK